MVPPARLTGVALGQACHDPPTPSSSKQLDHTEYEYFVLVGDVLLQRHNSATGGGVGEGERKKKFFWKEAGDRRKKPPNA